MTGLPEVGAAAAQNLDRPYLLHRNPYLTQGEKEALLATQLICNVHFFPEFSPRVIAMSGMATRGGPFLVHLICQASLLIIYLPSPLHCGLIVKKKV